MKTRNIYLFALSLGVLLALGSGLTDILWAQNEALAPDEFDQGAPEYKDLIKENYELKQNLDKTKNEYDALLESYNLTDKDPEVTKLIGENQSLKKQYIELSEKYENIEKDRNNILIQTKRLLQEKRSVADLETELAQYRDKTRQLETVQQASEIQDLKWQDKMREMEESIESAEAERDHFRESYEEAKSTTAVRDLKNRLKTLEKESRKTIDALEKENRDLAKGLKQKERDIEQLSTAKTEAEVEVIHLTRMKEDFEKKYQDALERNLALERNIEAMPQKFTEIARQNESLRDDTAKMHYNLGVFYTKSREYKRAINEFEKALEVKPQDGHAHFNLGYIYAQYLIDRERSIDHFRHFLRTAKNDDKDADWVRRYLLTWETYNGETPPN